MPNSHTQSCLPLERKNVSTNPPPQEEADAHQAEFTSDEYDARLEDITELLHLWMNEAYAYRFLSEAVITGRYSKQQAKQALESPTHFRSLLLESAFTQQKNQRPLVTPEPSHESEGETIPNASGTSPSDLAPPGTECFGHESLKCRSARYTIHLTLSEPEHQALTQLANQTNLPPHQLLWTALDSLMNSRDDPDVLKGCQEAAQIRFQQNTRSDWAHPSL